MPLFIWDESLSVGVAEIDDQHRHLLALINDLYESMVQGKEKMPLEKIIGELEDYTIYHFAEEEEEMTRNAYPDLEPHRRQHAHFREMVSRFKNDILNEKASLEQDILLYLKEWVKMHISSSDKKYAAWHKAQPPR
jgi:methyl-accepting chemotaxis protein/hemerythrin